MSSSTTPEPKAFNVASWKRFARRLGKNADLTPEQVAALRADIKLLIEQRQRWRRTARIEQVKIDGRTTVLRRKKRYDQRKYKGRLVGANWTTNARSRGPCPVCHRPLPHRDRAARRYHHIYRVGAMGRKTLAAMMRAGEHRPWTMRDFAGTSARCRAQRVRTFEEEAAHVASVLGPARVAEIVASYGNARTYVKMRQWVRCRYGAGRKRRRDAKGLTSGAPGA